MCNLNASRPCSTDSSSPAKILSERPQTSRKYEKRRICKIYKNLFVTSKRARGCKKSHITIMMKILQSTKPIGGPMFESSFVT